MEMLKYLRVQWDRAGAALSLGLAALCFVFGWIGVGHTPFTAQQLPYVVSGGLGGMLFLTVAAVLWLSADLRDEWRKLDAIERHLEASAGPTAWDGNLPVVSLEERSEGRVPAEGAVR